MVVMIGERLVALYFKNKNKKYKIKKTWMGTKTNKPHGRGRQKTKKKTFTIETAKLAPQQEGQIDCNKIALCFLDHGGVMGHGPLQHICACVVVVVFGQARRESS